MTQPARDGRESSQRDVTASDAAGNLEPGTVPSRHLGWRPFHTGMVAGALVAVAVTLLIVQNGHSVRVNWLAFHFRSPEWIVLFVTAAAGAVVWELIRAGFRRRGRRRSAGEQGGPNPAG